MGRNNVQALQDKITDLASKVLTSDTVASAITPTLNDVFKNGRADLISIGFLLSLWSGSRVLNVFVDTISIMYGQSGVRGIVRTRVLSFSLYVASLVVGVVIFPLVVLGPQLLGDILDGHAEFLLFLYWPGRHGAHRRQPVVALLDLDAAAYVVGAQRARRPPSRW